MYVYIEIVIDWLTKEMNSIQKYYGPDGAEYSSFNEIPFVRDSEELSESQYSSSVEFLVYLVVFPFTSERNSVWN
jgi:hypothetical protein